MLPDQIEFINEPQKFLDQYRNTDQYKEGHQEGWNVAMNESKMRFHKAIDPCVLGENSKYFIGKAYKSMFGIEYKKLSNTNEVR